MHAVYSDLSIEYKTALLYGWGGSFGNIEKELSIPRVYVKRNLQKICESWLGLQRLNILEAEKREEAPISIT